MNATVKLGGALAALLLAGCNAGGSSDMPTTAAGGQLAPTQFRTLVPDWQAKDLAEPACPQVVGKPTCLALVESTGGISPDVAGWQPVDFQTRYHLPSSTNGSGQIVAIVDAFDNPVVASDLAAYRTEFNLGKATFHKYNQYGQQKHYPVSNRNWGIEIDLDVEMVSAVCPKCTIDLVEAKSSSSRDLETAEAEAVKLGAHIVSNSWICYNSPCGTSESYFDAPGVLYLAASGDRGWNNNGPPMWFPSVVSVGGTVLSKSGSAYSETVWNGTGSGCSMAQTKPSWQHDPACNGRTDNDTAAVAWQVAEYDAFGYGGWFTIGGTSVASPIIAGIYGLAGDASTQNAAKKLWKLKRRQYNQWLNDITTGKNGECNGSEAYLCRGERGYDGPTGWGTPNGIRAY